MIDTFLIESVSGKAMATDRVSHLVKRDDAALARIEQDDCASRVRR